MPVRLWVRLSLSLRNTEHLLHKLGIDLCHKTMWFCWHRIRRVFAAGIRNDRVWA